MLLASDDVVDGKRFMPFANDAASAGSDLSLANDDDAVDGKRFMPLANDAAATKAVCRYQMMMMLLMESDSCPLPMMVPRRKRFVAIKW